MSVSLAYNKDCMEYMASMPDEAFDLAIVDPPYGIGETWRKITKNRRCDQFPITSYTNEQRPTAEYFDELRRVAKDWIIWGYNYYADILGNTNYLIVWDKMCSKNNVVRFSKCEIACTSKHIPCNIVSIEWEGYRMGKERGIKKIHPHQKPIALYEWLLSEYANPHDRILDTHLGSGSSRIAAYNLGFDFVGIEIDPTFFATQERRFQEYTSQLKIKFHER